MEGIYRTIAIAILLAWPVIPLFWLPVRLCPRFCKALGKGFYLVLALLWLLAAGAIWHWKAYFLSGALSIPYFLRTIGWIFMLAGVLLQMWTALVLGRRITGLPELEKLKVSLETRPPFNLCRHPTYLAHLLIFGGSFLATGLACLFFLSLVDFLITRFIIIPFEERELEERFGQPYKDYKKAVSCFFPWKALLRLWK